MSKLSKNILYNVSGQVALAVLNLVAVRATFRQLGDDVFGLFVLGWLIGAIIRGISQGSFNALIVREVSRFVATDREVVRQTMQMGSFASWSAFGLASIGLAFAAPWIVGDWITLTSLDEASATTLIRIVGVGAFLSLPNMFLDAVLRGLEEMRFTNLVDVLVTAVYRLGLVMMIQAGATWFEAALWFVATSAIGIGLLSIAIIRFLPSHYLLPRPFPEVIRRNWTFVRETTILGITLLIHRNADKLIVGRLMPIATLGYYSFAFNLINQMTTIRGAVTTAALPSFARLYQQKAQQRILQQFETLHQLLSYGMVPLFAAVVFLSIPLYTYVFSAEVANLLLAPTALLAFGSYLSVMLATPNGVSLAFGKSKINMSGNLWALLIVLPLTAILIYYAGLVGGGLSWVLYWLVLYAYNLPRACRECLGVSVKRWYKEGAMILLCIAATYGIAWGTVSYRGDYSLPTLVAAYLAATAVYALIAYRLIAPDVRARLFSEIGRVARWQPIRVRS
jgi:O-antigen/teichoic acid export membrane protein